MGGPFVPESPGAQRAPTTSGAEVSAVDVPSALPPDPSGAMSDSGSRMGAVDRAQVRPSAAVLPSHRGFTCLDVGDQVARHAVCSVRIEGVRGSNPQLHPGVTDRTAGLIPTELWRWPDF